MDRLQAENIKQHPLQIANSSHENGNSHKNDDDDDIFVNDEPVDDDQARIRRRAPTRHSIKSLTGRKSLGKQTTNTEVKNLRYKIFLLLFMF